MNTSIKFLFPAVLIILFVSSQASAHHEGGSSHHEGEASHHEGGSHQPAAHHEGGSSHHEGESHQPAGHHEGDFHDGHREGSHTGPNPGLHPAPNPNPGPHPTPKPNPGPHPAPNPNPGPHPTPKPNPGPHPAPKPEPGNNSNHNGNNYNWNHNGNNYNWSHNGNNNSINNWGGGNGWGGPATWGIGLATGVAAPAPWSWGYWPHSQPFVAAPLDVDDTSINYSQSIVWPLSPVMVEQSPSQPQPAGAQPNAGQSTF